MNMTMLVFRLRLVMPPVLFYVLQAPFTRLAHILFPAAMANGIIAGSFTFCKYLNLFINYYLKKKFLTLLVFFADVLYDCMHYA
jgi:hypothetical protein